MSGTFDPYHRWLGIPPKHQPPNHYRLLGLEPFENDLEVIRDAAERQMAHVRGYQLGRYSALSQKILNELGVAKACLSVPADKARYDGQLREQPAWYDRQLMEQFVETELPPLAPSRKRISWKNPPVVWGVLLVGVLLLIVLVLLTLASLSGRPGESGKIVSARALLPHEPPPLPPPPPSAKEKQPESVTVVPREAPERPETVSPPLGTSAPESTSPELPPKPQQDETSPPPTAELTEQSNSNREATVTTPKETTLDLGGGVKLELVLIPAGEFLMGSPDSDHDANLASAKPQHRVRITKPFYLGKYHVTQEQWQAVMGNNPSGFKGLKNPVEQVSWDDCQQFFDELTAKSGTEGGKFQLPTEAQWEYACRAGSTGKYYFGDNEGQLGDYAWFDGNSGKQTRPVGLKRPNAWGLYDMHGNVWEWCADWYGSGYYGQSPPDGPTGPTTGSRRVIRGGSWKPAGSCRSAHRSDFEPEGRVSNLGLRVSLVPADTAAGTEVAPLTSVLKLRPIEAQAIKAGNPLNVQVLMEDADAWAGKVYYALVGQVPVGAKIDQQSGNFTWTPTAEQAHGEHNITVSVTAPDGHSDQRSFTVNATTLTLPPKPPSHKKIAIALGSGVKLEMVLIPTGEFLMGSPDSDHDANLTSAKPQHRVRITKPFYLGKYLVTQEQWQAVMGNNPSQFKGPKNPVENVSWNDCQQFLDKLNGRQGSQAGKFQLPTEAQWEYACRAGHTTRFYFGDNESKLGEYAWYGANSGGKTHAVGEKKLNAWGLCEMQGNVWEWCEDWHDSGYYAASPADDPTGPTSGSSRVFRGGSWDAPVRNCQTAYRWSRAPGDHGNSVGLRVSFVPAELNN